MHTQSADDIYAVGMLLTELAFGKEVEDDSTTSLTKMHVSLAVTVPIAQNRRLQFAVTMPIAQHGRLHRTRQ